MTELQAWNRQPGETAKAYQAFVVYRNLTPTERSLARVGSELVKSVSLIARWSARWDWVERAQEWDHEQQMRELTAHIETKKKMDEEHLKIVRTARNKAVKILSETELEGISLSELRAWLVTFMSWERLILGEPESIEERRTKIEAKDWDLEKEMEELLPIVEDMYRRGILSEPWEEA